MFKLHIEQVQCKHVIFGGSSDNGYARLFGPYTADDEVRKRITLLEGPPFAGELAVLKDKFNIESFQTIFRDRKYPPRRVSFSTPAVTSPQSASLNPTSWVAAVQNGTTQPETRIAPAQTPAPTSSSQLIPRNNRGQRVDLPITVPRYMVNEIKRLKLCNNHYLAAPCHFADCQHPHHVKLNETQTDALRCVARMAPCKYGGLYCDKRDCYYGHKCFREPCDKRLCEFPDEMHGVDQRVVNL